jgi:TRAP-type C4-dicarboxylate transport system permease small subunit
MDKSVMGFRFPMYLFTAALPFGFALTSLRLIEDIVSVVKKKDLKN